MASLKPPSPTPVTLNEILDINKSRKLIINRIHKLELEYSKETEQENKTKIYKTLVSLRKKANSLEADETELLVKAGSTIQFGYRAALSETNPTFSELASQVTFPTDQETPSFSGHREVSLISSEEESTDTDKTELTVEKQTGIDTSPNTGFVKFGIKTDVSQKTPAIVVTSETKVKKKRTKTKTKPEAQDSFRPPSPPKFSFDSHTPKTPATPKMATSVVYSPPALKAIYDGTSNVDRFFNKYEAYAATFSWKDDMKLSQLQFHLDKSAYKCYENLKKTLSSSDFDYDTVKARLKKYFASKSSPQEYDKKLRERKLMYNEPIDQYFWDVVELVYKVDKSATFDKIKEHVLKGLPQEIAKDIWKAKPADLEKLQEMLLDHQKFESLMGKKVYGNNEQAINEVVNQLQNMGFSVQKPEANFASNAPNKKKNKKGKNKSNSQGPPPGPPSRSQFRPRGAFQNNRRGRWPPQNNQVRFQPQQTNPWSNQGQFRDDRYSRRDQYPQNNRGFGRQGTPRFQNRQFHQGNRGSYINNYENYNQVGLSVPQLEPAFATPVHNIPQALPYNQQAVNTYYSGNE